MTPHPLNHPVFREIDRQFGRLMERLAGGELPDVALAAALASCCARQGRVCADLRAPDAGMPLEGEASLTLPECEAWLEQLRGSRVVGLPGDFKPLILDAEGRLYLHRCHAGVHSCPQ
jgi:exodeoxyribonuclease V alpha subunit